MKVGLLLFCFLPLIINAQEDPEEVFMIVEKMPKFPGGEKAMFEFLTNNVIYPELDKEEGIEGLVVAGFIVEKDGKITNIRIDGGRNNTELMDQEVIRVIKLMPDWEPGMENDEAVRVSMKLPVRFQLANREVEKKETNTTPPDQDH